MNVCAVYPSMLKIGDFPDKDKAKRFYNQICLVIQFSPDDTANIINKSIAQTYCGWLSCKSKQSYILPSSA